jgi:hypothetical protein
MSSPKEVAIVGSSNTAALLLILLPLLMPGCCMLTFHLSPTSPLGIGEFVGYLMGPTHGNRLIREDYPTIESPKDDKERCVLVNEEQVIEQSIEQILTAPNRTWLSIVRENRKVYRDIPTHRRIVKFKDGASLEMIIRDPPQPSEQPCP